MAFTQNLPFQFDLNKSIDVLDVNFYVFWFDQRWHRSVVNSWKEATDFCHRANQRNVGAYASGIVPGIGENRRLVFAASFCGPLRMYASSDRIALQILGLAHEFWREEQKAQQKLGYIAVSPRIQQKKAWSVPENTPEWMFKLMEIGFDEEFTVSYEHGRIIVESECFEEISFEDGKYYVCRYAESYDDNWHEYVTFRFEDLHGDWEAIEDLYWWQT